MMIRKFLKMIDKIVDPKKRILFFGQYGFYRGMSDKDFCSKKFRLLLNEEIDWENPKTFNQKLQWLKLNYRKPEFTVMVDKYKVREYIAKTIGEEYLIPLLGVYDSVNEIDFDKLPDQFVLKCNHNSGVGMCICRDKSKLNFFRVKAMLRKGLKQDYYITNREFPYKDVPRKIVCEKYMQDSDNPKTGLTDYKFYCFNGEPQLLYVSTGLENHDTAKMSFLNVDWTFTNFGRTDYLPLEQLPKKPENFEKMLEISRILAKDIPFLRVDLYEINHKIYFGELTFSPCGGLMPFQPKEADLEIGKLLDISYLLN